MKEVIDTSLLGLTPVVLTYTIVNENLIHHTEGSSCLGYDVGCCKLLAFDAMAYPSRHEISSALL
jgi:hypothetical protein